jgi:Glycosyl hydrolase family 65 central catalytic domain
MSASTTSGKTESSAAPPDAYNALVHKTALDPSEVETWVRAAENMYVPYDEKLKIILQDDCFLDRERWDFRNTPPERYPLLLNTSEASDETASVASACNSISRADHAAYAANMPGRAARSPPVHAQGPRLAPSKGTRLRNMWGPI